MDLDNLWSARPCSSSRLPHDGAILTPGALFILYEHFVDSTSRLFGLLLELQIQILRDTTIPQLRQCVTQISVCVRDLNLPRPCLHLNRHHPTSENLLHEPDDDDDADGIDTEHYAPDG